MSTLSKLEQENAELMEKINKLESERNSAIALMSKSWQLSADAHENVIFRYVSMAEALFETHHNEVKRLTAICTAKADRCDELYIELDELLYDLSRFKSIDMDHTVGADMRRRLDSSYGLLEKIKQEAESE